MPDQHILSTASPAMSYQKQAMESAPHPSSKAAMDQNAFYVNLFVNQPAWSTPEPNPDEAARWSKIASFLEFVPS